MPENNQPEICDYEGSHYRTDFWENKDRDYEDRVERVAIDRLLPPEGQRLLELGAGFGRLTGMFTGYDQVVILDYSQSQLEFARETYGDEGKLYVAANIYSMPFAPAVFDAATMIRVLHHMEDPAGALAGVRYVMREGGTFLLEFANKKNLKAIARWLLKKQDWNPFSREPVEFVDLNFDFHPAQVDSILRENAFETGRRLTVSHFRMKLLKKTLPTSLLVWLDSLAQLTGDFWQLSPSVFVKNTATGEDRKRPGNAFWRCTHCGSFEMIDGEESIYCEDCGKRWSKENGIYNFKAPIN